MLLPDETRVFVGHDYLPKDGRQEFAWETTIGEEKRNNIHVGGGKSAEEFCQMRDTRDAQLAIPKLIVPSVQVNIRAGRFPEPDANGNVALSLPINKLSNRGTLNPWIAWFGCLEHFPASHRQETTCFSASVMLVMAYFHPTSCSAKSVGFGLSNRKRPKSGDVQTKKRSVCSAELFLSTCALVSRSHQVLDYAMMLVLKCMIMHDRCSILRATILALCAKSEGDLTPRA